MNFSRSILLYLATLGSFTRAVACDACALAIDDTVPRPGFTATVAHQYTRLGTVWQGDQALGNPADQSLDSHITQFALGCSTGGAWQWQLTIPYVSRAYRRPDHALIETGRVRGLGDTTLALRYQVWSVANGAHQIQLNLLGGVKFATGKDDLLGDEVGHHFHHHTGVPDSGIHGHDLAPGSGSTDGVLGIDGRWTTGRLFARGQLQYKLRQPGAFDYRLADETSWEIGVGTIWREFSVEALFSADHKGLDDLAGVTQPDTGSNVRYLGARIGATLGSRLEADLSVELPVRIRTSETMIAPDYRLRAGLRWRF